MSLEAGAIQLGAELPSVRLKSGNGEEVDLVLWRGRPLVVVCVRYYG